MIGTIAVQVIAENLDSVNDVVKKIEVLDTILDHLVKRLEDRRLPATSLPTASPVPGPEVSGNGKEVISAVQAVAETIRGVEESLNVVGQDMGVLGGALDEMGGQIRGLERHWGPCSGLEGLVKVQSALEGLGRKVGALGGGLTASKNKEGSSKEEAKLENVSELTSRMDELHDLVAGNGESFSKGLAAVQQHVVRKVYHGAIWSH